MKETYLNVQQIWADNSENEEEFPKSIPDVIAAYSGKAVYAAIQLPFI